MALTVQVQDIAHGCPAGGVEVRLERQQGRTWTPVGRDTTDDAGRIGGHWGPADGGVFRLVFEAEKFFASLGLPAALAEITVALRVVDPADDHRVAVLLAPVAATLQVEGPLS